MRSTIFLGLFAAGFGALALSGVGCGGGNNTGTGGTGTGGGTTSSSTTSSSSGVTTTGTGTGGNGGAGGGSMCATSAATAQDIMLNDMNATMCNLPDPSADANFFKFTGTKGEAVAIATSAKVGMDPFDTTYLDTVVTLYDANMNQLARNDDPTPRFTNDAELFTVLPADGDYIVEVQECNAVFGSNCASAGDITNNDYTIQIFDTGPGAMTIVGEANATSDEANDASDPTKLQAMKYLAGMNAGSYYDSKVFGFFNTATDVDVYSFKLPKDLKITEGRVIGYFSPYPAGTDGDGSTAPIGKMWVVDPTDMAHQVVAVDSSLGMTPGELSGPLTLDKEYYFFVTRPSGSAGTNDFYWVAHYGGGSNPVEAADVTNNLPATPEALMDTMDTGFLATYYVDGDISTAADVDYYAMDVPAGAAKVSVGCGAQRSGSGLRGFKVSLLKSDGTTPLASNASSTEKPDTDLFLDSIAVPSGATKILIKAEAASQDPVVTSTFYRCGIRFQ